MTATAIKTDKEKYLEFWGYNLGTAEAEAAWDAKLKMMHQPANKSGNLIMGDQYYDGLCASDGTDISTRSKHREYMKRNGLVTFDDYAESFKKAEAERTAYRTGESGSVSRRDIENTIRKLTGY